MKANGPKPRVLAASIGSCVHVAGVLAFLEIAEAAGYETAFMGPAAQVRALLKRARDFKPDIIAVSYRLDPTVLGNLLDELREGLKEIGSDKVRLLFGGTPATCEVAKKSGLFDAIFQGGEPPHMVKAILTGESGEIRGELCGEPSGAKAWSTQRQESGPMTPGELLSRIEAKRPFPLIRHHFGLPTVKDTVDGTREIALAGVVDVISIGPDQNAQEHFFHPEEMDRSQDGAGGVPIRSAQDLSAIYEATRCGNYPLLRCYSGTRDIIRMAEVLRETIRNAWCAVPLFWYNVLDGRSKRPLRDAIRENQQAMAWHAERGIPVEVNESHHWSLRNAPDAVAVAAAFLAAYNAKAMGVRYYVAQYMLNTPPATTPRMDLAKMLAKIAMIESLHDDSFQSYRETRGGLASMARDASFAKGQLAASTFLGMMLKPSIVHVVGYSEAHDVARPAQVIESCKIAQGTIHNVLDDLPDPLFDPRVKERRDELIEEARVILDAIRELGHSSCDDPLCDPDTLARAVELGILDAPHLAGNPHACGKIATRMINGACRSCDPFSRKPISEKQRIKQLLLNRA
ncbi:MAG TPA: methionine synthase [Firmicutes bacterium]|nr:methionine synthase [Bacillota bacterium]